MNPVKVFLSRWWCAAGYAAARQGDDKRALERFDRSLRFRDTFLVRAFRAMVLMALGRSIEARREFMLVAQAPSNSANVEYARLYAQTFLAYVESRHAEADRFWNRLNQIECDPNVKNILIPFPRPSQLAAESMLKRMGVENGDPLGFRDASSGLHWINAVRAYAAAEFDKALTHVNAAEAAMAPSPAQRALKAGLLANLGRAAEADMLLDELIEELGGADLVDERYIRLYSQYHRSEPDSADKLALFAQAYSLASQTALRVFLPIEPDPIEVRFPGKHAGYSIVRSNGLIDPASTIP